MKRYKHSLSHSHLTTFNMGQLIPVGLTEVLPGDTIQQSSSALIRVTPLAAPVMHPVVVRIHHWFVPNRLVWDGWEDFITGGPDGMGGDAGGYPAVNSSAGFAESTLADYFGLPARVPNMLVSLLPFRGYNLIFNNWYRDQDLQAEVDEDNLLIQRVSWEKDYFTTARPWPQKGPEVTFPLGTSAPVKSLGDGRPVFSIPGVNTTGLGTQTASPNIFTTIGSAGADSQLVWSDPKLYADLSTATAANVNEVRRAFAIQRYQEARARYGSRYTEYLRYLGVKPSDARLQLPEYLGGGKQMLTFSEVLQTSPNDSSAGPEGVGQFTGHGIAGLRTASYRRFFEEHGYVFTLMSVRPRTMYSQGVHRTWLRRSKEDYWQKELEQIGQQEIKKIEIYATGNSTTDQETWGYQDRYREYKGHRNMISGEFQSTLDYWHYGRLFASEPALNASFVECDPTKRVYQEQTANELLVQVGHSIQARRMVSKSNASRIV